MATAFDVFKNENDVMADCVPIIFVLSKTIQRVTLISVLKKCGRSNWASGTFIIPKKDEQVR